VIRFPKLDTRTSGTGREKKKKERLTTVSYDAGQISRAAKACSGDDSKHVSRHLMVEIRSARSPLENQGKFPSNQLDEGVERALIRVSVLIPIAFT
jgi:hypothetical protein